MKQDKYYSQKRMNRYESMRDIFNESTDQEMLQRLDRIIEDEGNKPRAKFNIWVNTHTDMEECVTIYSQITDENPLSDHTTFYAWLQKNFPLITWEGDDGADTDEEENTDFIQYVCYPDRDEKGYILATFFVTEQTHE